MPTLNDLIDSDAQRLDTGFTFTEGPLYHPDAAGTKPPRPNRKIRVR